MMSATSSARSTAAMQNSDCPKVGRQRFSIARTPGITKRS